MEISRIRTVSHEDVGLCWEVTYEDGSRVLTRSASGFIGPPPEEFIREIGRFLERRNERRVKQCPS